MSDSNTFKVFILRHGQSELNHENIFCGWIDAKLTEKGKLQADNSASLIQQYCNDNNQSLPQIGYCSRLIRTQQTIQEILNQWNLTEAVQVVTGIECQYNDLNITNNDNNDKDNNDDINNNKKNSSNGNDDKKIMPILQTWRLNERHYGSWQGQRKPQVLEEYGEKQYMYIRRGYNGKPPMADLDREMVQEINDKGSSTGYDFKEPNRHLKYGLEEKSGEILPNSESLADVVKRVEPFLENVVFRIANENNQDSCLIVAHGSSVRSILKLLQGIPDDEIKDVDIPNGIPLVIELEKKTFKFVNKFYLDPENAKINAQKVRDEGFASNP
ncbi:hypothetical protein Kpol_1045p50 [Vanderwaltozyma polyspora DSM 70294]|uniref:Phosphoglycerate mutase n=1 Tax=Vanderwaltozyma polyspora (strain ATCC 22028 / DSM 70294 / BCRC 21397 / CBS 2163 / NBRC 10782 / NRRL Y-8283 / UCD 57-17) TaxID=436907 RepID=A7TI56_VANPO|nr:uncharacterized protein Kpol_1045p50 [Vanderwaltozyma polyspora DSM 70294]EDO18063.1 hypothetical protein Kpol_1045p50 [Vanderwaltozyma polyspora DSM 70294]